MIPARTLSKSSPAVRTLRHFTTDERGRVGKDFAPLPKWEGEALFTEEQALSNRFKARELAAPLQSPCNCLYPYYPNHPRLSLIFPDFFLPYNRSKSARDILEPPISSQGSASLGGVSTGLRTARRMSSACDVDFGDVLRQLGDYPGERVRLTAA